jgi:hypothetical protein
MFLVKASPVFQGEASKPLASLFRQADHPSIACVLCRCAPLFVFALEQHVRLARSLFSWMLIHTEA